MQRAFTLLELILVLAIVGLLAAVAAARLNGLRGTQAVEVAARALGGQAQRARALAMQRAEPVRLRLDLAAPSAEVRIVSGAETIDPADGGDALVELRSGAEAVSAAFARDDRVPASGVVDILFWPDGRSDPAGTWTIAGAGRSAAVRIPGSPLPVTVAVASEAAHAP